MSVVRLTKYDLRPELILPSIIFTVISENLVHVLFDVTKNHEKSEKSKNSENAERATKEL